MTEADCEARYRRYLAVLNERRFDALCQFVHEALTYNGEPMTRLDYQDMIARDVGAVPDLRFDVDLLVARDDLVACRLNFACTPQSEFLGTRPNGKSISFSEHVFYKLRDGKFYEVWSLIERPAVEAQLTA